MKFDIVVADPPYYFKDELKMEDVARGASSNYPTLDIEELKKLPIKKITTNNSLLALWVPSSLLQEGLDLLKAWNFEHKQTWIWVKTKKDSFLPLLEDIIHKVVDEVKKDPDVEVGKLLRTIHKDVDYDLNSSLSFGMGRLFRQTHEVVLLGTRGKIYSSLKNRSQRSVHMDYNEGHSKKPEALQDSLDLMFPNLKKLELFARRQRPGWVCLGNESTGESQGEDIRDSITKLRKTNRENTST